MCSADLIALKAVIWRADGGLDWLSAFSAGKCRHGPLSESPFCTLRPSLSGPPTVRGSVRLACSLQIFARL
jgi:hypothetical protein